MTKGRDTGTGEDYSAPDTDSLVDAMEAQYDSLDTIGGGSAKMTVTAQIEWAGTVDNNRNGGVRTTKLNLPSGAAADIKAAIDRARASGERGKSYKAQGSSARLRELERTRRGQGILASLGFNPSRETRRRWSLSEGNPLSQKPGRANQDRINQAYERLRDTAGPSRESRSARRAVANRVTNALKDEYGVNVRLRDIRSLDIE
jgi:hypothetical protein